MLLTSFLASTDISMFAAANCTLFWNAQGKAPVDALMAKARFPATIQKNSWRYICTIKEVLSETNTRVILLQLQTHCILHCVAIYIPQGTSDMQSRLTANSDTHRQPEPKVSREIIDHLHTMGLSTLLSAHERAVQSKTRDIKIQAPPHVQPFTAKRRIDGKADDLLPYFQLLNISSKAHIWTRSIVKQTITPENPTCMQNLRTRQLV